MRDEDEDPDEDSESRRVATARVDMVIKCSRGFEGPVIVLLLEHKRPGTLDRSDWTDGIHCGSHILERNAKDISKQSRKYMAAAVHNITGIYDTTALVGCMLNYRNLAKWATREEIEMKVFFEDRIERFLTSILAMITMSLEDRKLISRWRW